MVRVTFRRAYCGPWIVWLPVTKQYVFLRTLMTTMIMPDGADDDDGDEHEFIIINYYDNS